jgi:hypothetical protein
MVCCLLCLYLSLYYVQGGNDYNAVSNLASRESAESSHQTWGASVPFAQVCGHKEKEIDHGSI